jgi:hypothetical protein
VNSQPLWQHKSTLPSASSVTDKLGLESA